MVLQRSTTVLGGTVTIDLHPCHIAKDNGMFFGCGISSFADINVPRDARSGNCSTSCAIPPRIGDGFGPCYMVGFTGYNVAHENIPVDKVHPSPIT